MNIRAATADDGELLGQLVEEFESSLPAPLPYAGDTPDEDLAKLSARMRDGLVLIAEEDARAVGFASADFERGRVFVVDLYVFEDARRRGVGRELLRRVADEARDRDCTHMELHVQSGNNAATAFYDELGFDEAGKILRIALDRLVEEPVEASRESYGALHVQTDDADAVERVVSDYLPRLVRGVSATVDRGRAWSVVRLDPFDRDALRKLGAELSYRFGVTVVLSVEDGAVVRFVVHDRGRMVDEYLSVPEYFGSLPPGDALALRANPTVVSRLTGADPARVRSVARTADSPAKLPPAPELHAQIAEVMGLEP